MIGIPVLRIVGHDVPRLQLDQQLLQGGQRTGFGSEPGIAKVQEAENLYPQTSCRGPGFGRTLLSRAPSSLFTAGQADDAHPEVSLKRQADQTAGTQLGVVRMGTHHQQIDHPLIPEKMNPWTK